MLLWWVCRGVGWFYGGFERTVGAFMVGLYRWLMFFFFLSFFEAVDAFNGIMVSAFYVFFLWQCFVGCL